MQLQSSTHHIAHRRNTDHPDHWPLRTNELDALTDALIADGVPEADAWQQAIGQLDELLELADAWDAAAHPDPTPPAPARKSRPTDPRTSWERACDKAALNLSSGATVIERNGAYLVQSATRASVVHRVSADGACTCEAGQAGRVCWHSAAAYLVRLEEQAELAA